MKPEGRQRTPANGDRVRIDISGRSIELLISEEELQKRRTAMEKKADNPLRHGTRAPGVPHRRVKEKVSAALRAYASMAASADLGAMRIVD